MSYPISLCMIVKNAETTLARCLNSVKGIVQEIIVVDTGSSDKTIEIARSFHTKVYQIPWEEDFSKARNFAIDKAINSWVLVLDADEWVDQVDARLLNAFFEKQSSRGTVTILNQYKQNGQLLEAIGVIVRVFPRNLYHYVGRVHEQVEPYDKNLDTPFVNAGITIQHDGYADEGRMNNEKFRRNLNLLQKELQENGESLYLLYQIGKTYFVHKDYESAKVYFEKAFLFKTENNRLMHSLINDYGHVLKELNYISESIKIIEDWLKVYTDSSELWFLLAALYTKRGTREDVERVINCYKNCLALGDTTKYDSVLGTGSFLAARNLALLLQLLGDNELAQEFINHSEQMRIKIGVKSFT